ncbi:MAG TPA: 50S ribosomal protein L23 [Candidatus Paceibacterota bacterium]|jgi:large subunit ribosomal protein L23
MALFSFGKKEKKVKQSLQKAASLKRKERTKEVSAAPKKKTQIAQRVAVVLIRPRITEKASFAGEKGAYVFDVASDATKVEVREAIQYYYKVTPRKVNVVTVPRKLIQSRFRGLQGISAGGKKAYVFLKKGDSIEVV